MKTNDGGPAYPVKDAHGFVKPGMTLRDYFAGQVLAAVARDALAGLDVVDMASVNEGLKAVAGSAYAMADAMLKARDAR